MGWIRGNVGELHTERVVADIPDVLLTAHFVAGKPVLTRLDTDYRYMPAYARQEAKGRVRSDGHDNRGGSAIIIESVGNQRLATYQQPCPSPFRLRIDC